MHGQFWRDLGEDTDKETSFSMAQNILSKDSHRSNHVRSKKPAMNTNYHSTMIHNSRTDPKCRLRKENIESNQRIVSGDTIKSVLRSTAKS